MLHPLLEKQKNIASEFGQLEALHELKQAGVALPEKYQAVLDRETQLQASMSKQPAHLKRLKGDKYSILISNLINLFVRDNKSNTYMLLYKWALPHKIKKFQTWWVICSWTWENSKEAAPEGDCPSWLSCWTTARTFRRSWNSLSGRKIKFIQSF